MIEVSLFGGFMHHKTSIASSIFLINSPCLLDYLYQLVEVQWARGATGGDQLCEFLGQDGQSSNQGTISSCVSCTFCCFYGLLIHFLDSDRLHSSLA